MASSGGAFSQTLQSITNTKLRELSKKREIFEDQKSSLLLEVKLETDQEEIARKLVEGVKKCFSVGVDRRGRTITTSIANSSLARKLKNFERFLQQARYDPSLSFKLLQDWERSLIQQLDIQSLKYQYATLYGQLVTEWLSNEQPAPVTADDVSEESEVFEKAARKERIDQRTEWENLVFQPLETDRKAMQKFLHDLFGKELNKEAFEALEGLRKSVEGFESSLAVPEQFNEEELKWVINGLLASDLLNEDKRAVLKDFLSNSVVLSEISDVLNMRLGALETWGWEGDVPVDQRRHVNGKYSVYMHEDLLQAIFLQYIGAKWSVFFKETLITFYKADGTWIPLSKPIPKLDIKRRVYFLGPQSKIASVQSKRRRIFESYYFMAKLLDSKTQDVSVEDGAEEALPPPPSVPPRMMMASRGGRMRMPKSHSVMSRASTEEDTGFGLMSDIDLSKKSPIETKQLLLHILSTEILLNTQLHGEITCLRSEFQNWGQSLPHSTITAILSFFGVSKKWLGFFLRFLQAPLRFLSDDSTVEPKIRKRGVPESHVLSEVFGEIVLFSLDYSINRTTEGGRLYRMHDEFWFWSSSHETCVKAWTTVERFADIMGVSINHGKTGSERILLDKKELPTVDPALPEGEIRWGFLYLNPELGRFVIDQSMVDAHIEELRLQLADKKSIFSWVQAWNTYAGTFFTTNFGRPANCYGQQHVDMILSTLSRIQNAIFRMPGGAAEHLKITIRTRFDIFDIPDGYLYFPSALGGLELQNTFIRFLQIRDTVHPDPAQALAHEFLETEATAYRSAKLAYESGGSRNHYYYEDPSWEPDDKDTFMSREEFSRYREDFCGRYAGDLHDTFNKLLAVPEEESVESNPLDEVLLDELGQTGGGIGPWLSMTPYWRWVVQLYGPDMVERFGGLSIVDRGLLPIGMVGLFRSGRVQWQG